MTDPEHEHDPVLDAEYREFVRSLHVTTIAAVSRVDYWWHQGQARATALFGLRGNRPDEDDVKRLAQEWREEIVPTLLPLVNGHPDPAVREAADYFSTRLIDAIGLMNRSPDNEFPDSGDQREVDMFALTQIDSGLSELRRAAYHAPFRIHRPEPDWEGVPIGNSEGTPDDILRRMNERGEHYKG